MKTLFTAFILCLCLRATAPATELSLSGGTNSPLTSATSSDTVNVSFALPTSSNPVVSNTHWMDAATPPTLTLDAPKSAPVVAKLDLALPAAAGAGVPDSWVYAALGTLLVALGWVCSGSLSRHRPAPLHTGGERRTVRAARAHMLPLDVSR